jgi:hypothetical protein
LGAARKRKLEDIVDREIVLRSEVQNAETRQSLHTATGAEFVALAALNLAFGLKCNEPVRVAEISESPYFRSHCAIASRRQFGSGGNARLPSAS